MKSTLKMILELENGKSTTLSVLEPREDITAAEVTEAVRRSVLPPADDQPVQALSLLAGRQVELGIDSGQGGDRLAACLLGHFCVHRSSSDHRVKNLYIMIHRFGPAVKR